MATTSDFGCALSAMSVQRCLTDQSGYFVIPSYQRPYRWGYEESCRLLSDISSYYVDDIRSGTVNGSSKNAKFLGTIIVVTEEQKEGQSDQCQSVIDGQQRLITFTLLFECLYHRLMYYKNMVVTESERDRQLVNVGDDIDRKLYQIEACLWKHQKYYEPKIGREEQDDWELRQYNSPTAVMGRLLFEKKDGPGVTQKYIDIPKSARAPENLYQVVESIELFIDLLVKGMDSDAISNTEAYKRTCLDLHAPEEFPAYPDIERYSGGRGYLGFYKKTNDLPDIYPFVEEAARLVSMVGFICDNVYIAEVVCQPENYLDIFESLNTAGRPLSPIETFTPEVYRFFNEQMSGTEIDINTPLIKGDKDGNSFGGIDFEEKGEVSVKEILDGIASLLQENKVSEADVGAIIISFALLYSGRKCGGRATDQRAELKKSFVEEACVECIQALQNTSPREALKPVLNYLRVLYQTVRWWSVLTKGKEEEIKSLCYYDSGKIESDSDKKLFEEALLALHVFREAKLTLAQTIACRFYIQYALIDENDEAKKQKAYREFLKVLRALLGFSTLWLGAVESTSGIEGSFREVLTGNTSKKIKKNPDYDYLKDSICLNRNVNVLVEADRVCERLRYSLCDRFGDNNGFTKLAWCNLVASTQAKRDAISRFMLLAYWQYTEKDEQHPGYRIRRRETGKQRDYFTVDSWKQYGSSRFDLEHIIPQTKNEAWAQATAGVDNRERIINQLGNYTLLPKNVNRCIGNKSWEIKCAVYRVLSEVDTELSDSYLQEFPPNQVKTLKRIFANPGEDTVSELVDDSIVWNPKFVQDRSKHMASIIWDNLVVKSSARSPFIDLTDLGHGDVGNLQENKGGASTVVDSTPSKEDKGVASAAVDPTLPKEDKRVAPAVVDSIVSKEDKEVSSSVDGSATPQDEQSDLEVSDVTSLYEVVCARIEAIIPESPEKKDDTVTWTTVDGKGYIKVVQEADRVDVIVHRLNDARAQKGFRPDRKTKSGNVYSFTEMTKFDEKYEKLKAYIVHRYKFK